MKKFNKNWILGAFLLIAIAFSIITVVMGVAPNPGHDFTAVSGGVAQGDLLYGSAVDTLLALPKNVTATRYLSNTGTTNNPAWAQVNLADGVTNDLPFANLTQGLALSVLGVTGNATADVASIAAGSDFQVLRRSGTTLGFGAIDLAQAAAVTGILPTIRGGTGIAFFTAAGPTAARTYTFPDANATIARTDAAQTFTGIQTFSTPIAAGSVAVMTNTVGGGVPTPPNNTTTFLRGDGTFATPSGTVYRTLVTLGSDVINANATANTLATCTGLSFAVSSGVTYRFSAVIPYTSAAATTGSRWTLTGPTTTALAYTSSYTITATTLTTNYASAYSIPAASNASSLTAGNIALINGYIIPSAAGTVSVQFASEVASSAITCKAGATLEWW